MKIHNKIDYEKTLGSMKEGETWSIPTTGDIQPIRSQVSKISKKLEGSPVFTVNKTPKGVDITRVKVEAQGSNGK